MNNILSYCGLVVARISASEKDLPVKKNFYLAHDLKKVRPKKVADVKRINLAP